MILLIKVRPVTGSCDIKCDIDTKCLVGNLLNGKYLLAMNLYCNKSVGRAPLSFILFRSSLIEGISS